MLAYSLGAQSPSAQGRDITKPTFPLRSHDYCSVPPRCNMFPQLPPHLGLDYNFHDGSDQKPLPTRTW